MKKLKLNIQYFASTNSTTHYDLSQYIASDKPTYLIDYNQDMSKIDTAIYNAMSKASVNESNIGTMTDLTTAAKTSLVNAINEINTQLGANTTNIGTNTSNIATLGTNMGDLVNLMTVAKNNLVSAINELKGVNDTQNTNIAENTANIEKFNLSVFKTYETSDLTDTSKFTITNFNALRSELTVATNNDGSIFKLYGFIRGQVINNTSVDIRLKNTGINPTSAFYVKGSGIINFYTDTNFNNITYNILGDFSVESNGDIVIHLESPVGFVASFMFMASLYFAKDFGDTPTDQ